jgi:hypothetical protein
MLHDLKEKSHEYKVLDDKIAYKDQEEYSTEIFLGYKTTFAYFNEFQKKNIQKNPLKKIYF